MKKDLLISAKGLRYVKIGFMVLLVLWASWDMARIREKALLFSYNIGSLAVAVCTAWLWYRLTGHRNGNRRLCIVSLAGGWLLSAAYVLGSYLYYRNDLGSGFLDYLRIFILILALCPLTIPLVSELLWIIDQKSVTGMTCSIPPDKLRRKSYTISFLRDWIIIFACHFPVFLAFWPTNFIFDAKYQMVEVLNNSYKVHHPLLHTWMMGVFYKWGVDIGNVSLGFSGYTIIQLLILSASFAYVLHYLRKRDIPLWMRVITLLFFAIFPLNPAFAITATKDVLFTAFFVFFLIYYFRYLDQEKFGWKDWISFFLFGVLTLQFRKNAVFALIFMMIIYAFRRQAWKQKGLFLLFLLAVVVASHITDNQLIKGLHAYDGGSRREMLSVPLQQMARVAGYHGDELPGAWYEEMLLYASSDTWKSYNPFLSDPVKGSADELLLRSNMLNFFKLWVKIGFRFPGEYIESFCTNTMGYWYPGEPSFAISDGTNGIALYHTLIGVGEEEEIVKKSYCKPVEILYSYLFYEGKQKEVPVLGFLCRPVPYLWILVMYALVCFYRKDKKGLLYALLPLGYFLTCFMGPTASLRYVYCMVVAAPLFVIRIAVRRKDSMIK
jgi:hypothetical protein